MKRLLIVGVAVLALLFPTAAAAYDGRGSDNLPCEAGGYWIINHLESSPPMLSVDGTTAMLVKVVGNGSTAHYASVPVTAASVVTVVPDVGQLQLSHCLTPTPTSTPSPSASPTPTPSPSSTPSFAPTPTPPTPTLPPTDTEAASDSGSPSVAEWVIIWLLCFIAGMTLGTAAMTRRQ